MLRSTVLPSMVPPMSMVPPTVPVPAPCGVGAFAPLRVRGAGAYRLRRTLRGQWRALAACLALAGAALAVMAPGGVEERPTAAPSPPESARPSAELVSASVRIADAATVRLLRPGDRVDVIAIGAAGEDADARVVARGVRVAKVPYAGAGAGTQPPGGDHGGLHGPQAGYPGVRGDPGDDGAHGEDGAHTDYGDVGGFDDPAGGGAGALVTLSVERSGAAALLGAGVSGRLAVAVSR
ncbi:hypothetical protein EES43_11480 [Streptomyces sp. ADI96-02]|uniref:hypothetical protein n=1 Tax=Streptomyces sp. ADI96-02 TaxID=1522760 RepID=UPI000FB516AB|nr:hypothetical protein [Streptomyces sp. ADI96-02]RPK63493.1 hypothetical protein EES43_11480 [Streptomyces sp. ADI96-02]